MATWSGIRHKLENDYLAESLKGRIQYDSLNSDDLIVRIFAILDRRTGKRRLIYMYHELNPKDEIFNMFYSIRINAENIVLD